MLAGEVVFWAGERRVVGATGTFLHVPRGVPHHFKNESNREARLLIWISPAGIEAMMERMADSPDDYVEIGKLYGVEFVDAP